MSMAADAIDRLLDPVSDVLGIEACQRLANLRADAQTQTLIDQLAEKSNEGTLTDDEKDAYDSLVQTATVLAILKGKARQYLTSNGIVWDTGEAKRPGR